MAQAEIDKLKSVFPVNIIIDIQHVGSTAISGLSAKPILDIQIAVQLLENVKLFAVPILQKLGYEYWENNPDPKRHASPRCIANTPCPHTWTQLQALV